VLPLVIAGVGVTATGLLWRDNARLRAELGRARQQVSDARAEVEAVEAASVGASEPSRRSRPTGNPMALVGALGRAADRAEADGDAGPPRDWESRRDERQRRMRDLLGRRPGETDEEYRARVAPLVGTLLSIPRDRLGERRRQFEEAAGIDDEQRAKLDAAFDAAANELVGLANAAIASGDLTPYSRNTRGVLAFVGSTVGTVDGLYDSIGKVLRPEQLQVMQESGFDPLEYLGVTTRWESLNPPPPPSGG
jgi:hypothetical protein